jgi:hypothetical protein
MGEENLTPKEIRSPDHPAHSESLYQLRYPSPLFLRLPSKYCALIRNTSQNFEQQPASGPCSKYKSNNIISHPLDLKTTSSPPFYILPQTGNTLLSF